MKKPVILLVDDDSGVLEALEAALVPAFGEIARIEAFADPNEVLAEIPRWAAQDRSIAVAVVDQKMPGMTGVDLLVQLQEYPNADQKEKNDLATFGSMQTILLTGHAGLDSAIAAKNVTRVDRYLEKPWSLASLINTIGTLFRRFLDTSRLGTHHTFGEVVEAGDLEELLALTYQIYSGLPGIGDLLPAGDANLDVGPYDPLSRFFALFSETSGERREIGTLRVTGQKRTAAAETLDQTARTSPEVEELVSGERSDPLPLMKYFLDRRAVERLYRRVTERGEGIVEPRRLALDPTYRSAGGSVRHLASHIIESAVAFYFFFLGIENAILTICVKAHKLFYRPFGFQRADETECRFHPDLDVKVECLHGTVAGVPQARRGRLRSLTKRIQRTGVTCHCPTFPGCIPEPYASGDFSASDLFCPYRAKHVLTLGPSEFIG